MLSKEFIEQECIVLDAKHDALSKELLRVEGARRQLNVLIGQICRQEQEAADRVRMGIDGGPFQHMRPAVNDPAQGRSIGATALNEQTSELFATPD